MNTSRASSRKLNTSKSLIAFVAASWALTTTNSVSDVPRNAAARSMSCFWAGVSLASKRWVYGYQTYKSRGKIRQLAVHIASCQESVRYPKAQRSQRRRARGRQPPGPPFGRAGGRSTYAISAVTLPMPWRPAEYMAEFADAGQRQARPLWTSCIWHVEPGRTWPSSCTRRRPSISPGRRQARKTWSALRNHSGQ